MIGKVKSAILHLLDQRGLILLKKAEYERLAAAAATVTAAAWHTPPAAPNAAQAPAKPAAAPREPPPQASTAPPRPPALPPSPAPQLAPAPELRGEFEPVFARLQGAIALPFNQAFGIYCAIRYVTRSGIPGDVIDCGEGTPDVLAVIGASLVAADDRTRRLVLFDVTSDPRHRPAGGLPLWGADYDLMTGKRPRPRPPERALPEPLLASGYPIDQIVVARYPVDAIDLTRPISFLGLSSETYEANRAAVRTLAPRVSVGGVIAVEGNENTPRAAVPGCVQHRLDAVAEFLKAHDADLPFWQIVPEYRIGMKSRRFGENG